MYCMMPLAVEVGGDTGLNRLVRQHVQVLAHFARLHQLKAAVLVMWRSTALLL